jgi:hypothetical protein
MIELTVALLSGLIVAMGIVGLSREATQTFNDEARSGASEAALRGAIDRLRADLERAGYMSTGNILLDPALAIIPGSLAGSGNTATYKPIVTPPPQTGMSGIQNLASVFWVDSGSTTANGLTLSSAQTPALTPDLIQIAGNLSTSEQFDVQSVPRTNTACGAGGNVISLSANSPAMVRTLGGNVPITSGNAGTNGQILNNIFSPMPTAPATGSPASFLVRLIDRTAHTQYLATCPWTAAFPTAGVDASNVPYVRIDGTNTPILFSSATGGTTNLSTIGGVGGFCSGCQINPVQVVQWEITQAGATDNEPTAYVSNLDFQSLTATTDATKYDLMRTLLDATGHLIPSTSEIVAEYAVDLAFAFTGDNGTNLLPAVPSKITSCAFDDTACNTAWGQRVSSVFAASQGPERIRSVRARIMTRTAQTDRAKSIPVAPVEYTTPPSQQFMYRYYISTATPTYARVRTVTTEVALPNQSRNFY